jgi:hypothetical protein
MLIFWNIRYIDTRDREFKDRYLWLETSNLDATTKAAVELCHALDGPGSNQDMLRYRQLFQEKKHSDEEFNELVTQSGGMISMSIPDYLEDENGKELTFQQRGQALTGDPDAIMMPQGAKKHDIDYMFAPKSVIDLRQINITQPDLDTLTYFLRDFRELVASSFFKEGPGTISSGSASGPVLQTAVSDEEIRSFVTIFRRLYMEGEPGNFIKAANVFASAILPHPLAKWVKGVANEYEQALSGIPDLVPFSPKDGVTFTRKYVINAFINTQYAHQGKKSRERQYANCLAEVNDQQATLFWVFLRSIWKCALYIRNAGVRIAPLIDACCKHHDYSPSAIEPASEYAGLGQLEKKPDREARIFNEKASELASTLWEDAGQPEGGPMPFLRQARKGLLEAGHGAETI